MSGELRIQTLKHSHIKVIKHYKLQHSNMQMPQSIHTPQAFTKQTIPQTSNTHYSQSAQYKHQIKSMFSNIQQFNHRGTIICNHCTSDGAGVTGGAKDKGGDGAGCTSCIGGACGGCTGACKGGACGGCTSCIGGGCTACIGGAGGGCFCIGGAGGGCTACIGGAGGGCTACIGGAGGGCTA